MPASGPIYRVLANVYEGALRRALRRPRLVMVLAVLAVVPGWWFWSRLDSGFMPEMDEGAFVLDYLLPPGTSLTQTDKVARRIDKILLETPDVAGYLRRAGAENGIYATEAFKGDIEVILKPAGQRRPYKEIKDELEEKLKSVPEADTEITPLIRDQINDLNGIYQAGRSEDFRAGPGRAPRPGGEGRQMLKEKVLRKEDIESVNTHAGLGNPDIIVRPDRAGAGPCRPDGAGPGEPTQRGPLRPDRRHAAGEGADHRHPHPRPTSSASIPTASSRFPSPCRRPPKAPAGGAAPPGFVLLRQLAAVTRERSPNELWRENQQPMINVTADVRGEGRGPGRRTVAEGTAEPSCPAARIPHGVGRRVSRPQQEAFASLAMVLLSAAALVYLLLGLSVPQRGPADADLPFAADLAGQRAGGLVAHRHAAERLVVHGRDPAHRPGRQERHHPHRVHRPASRRRVSLCTKPCFTPGGSASGRS